MLKRDDNGDITSSAWLHKVRPLASCACGETTLNGVSLEFCFCFFERKGAEHNRAGLCSSWSAARRVKRALQPLRSLQPLRPRELNDLGV